MTGEILAFDPDRRTNGRAIADAAKLGWLPEPVIDVTYGKGRFWSEYTPESLTTNDLYKPADHSFDHHHPFPVKMHGQYGCGVYDPDYKLQGKASEAFAERNEAYGVNVNKTVGERLEGIRRGVVTTGALVRVGGFLIVKVQDQVACGRVNRQTGMVTERLGALPGWTMLMTEWVDANPEWRYEACLHVVHSPPPQRSQRKPRNNFSTLLAFKRRRTAVSA